MEIHNLFVSHVTRKCPTLILHLPLELKYFRNVFLKGAGDLGITTLFCLYTHRVCTMYAASWFYSFFCMCVSVCALYCASA